MKNITHKYFGVIFFGILYLINIIIKVSSDLDRFLILMTIAGLIIPAIRKQTFSKG